MTRQEATEKILAAKRAKGLSFEQIAATVGRHKVWCTSALLGQQSMSAEEAQRVIDLLGLALEVGTAGIRVYAVCPGRVATDMQVQYSGRRVGMPPERVADAILDLAGHHPPIAPGRCLTIRG